MTTRRLLAIIFALLAAPLTALAQNLAQDAACPGFFPGGQPPALVNPKLAERTTLLCNDADAALASGVTRGPLWSAEHPTAASLAAARDTSRQGEFHPEARLPPEDRAQLDDYRRSGYDRGHMAPSGDMPDARAQQQSFSLANMVPQTGILNRGTWAGIESAVRDLAVARGELYLVTGPAFQGRQVKSIGPNGVLVPTSTWKAVYDPRAGGAGAYVCRNTARPTCSTVSVAALANLIGVDPFPALPSAVKQAAMALPPASPNRYNPDASRRRAAGGGEALPNQ